METTLHRQLKAVYCADPERHEVRIDGYRIDAVSDAGLIEIQQAGLGAIRTKVRALLHAHRVIVVKPLVARRVLIKRRRRGGAVQSTRTSPKHATFFDLFDDFVHFAGLFPHPRLSLDVLLTEQEEHRIITGQRRRRDKGYRVEDRRLVSIVDRCRLQHCEDLRELLPDSLPEVFSTSDIAERASVPRWLAQKAAYCLRMTGTAELVGKSGNVLLYRWSVPASRAA
ncbi:MAG: hypothetical protein AB7U20_12650 [Planctomycetaceae bacterium]